MNLLRFPLFAINFSLAMLLGFFVTRLFLPQLPTLPTAPPVLKNELNQRVKIDISPLLNRRWFGQLPSNPIKNVQLPETALNLTLQGILYSDDPQQTKVIIMGAEKKGETYRLGQTIQGAILQEIFTDRVILQRNGNQETLKLKKETTSSESSSQVSPAVSQPQINLKDYRQQLIDKPANLSKVVRIKPSETNGKLAGYELNAGNDPQIFQQLGFQNGDIAIKINDIPLDAPTQSFNALQQLSSAKILKVDILRKGVPQTISINLN
jgi:general secretion pathway protein C